MAATLQVAALPAPARTGRRGRTFGRIRTGSTPIATLDPRQRLHTELAALKAEADAVRRTQGLRPLSQAEIERALRQPSYGITDFRGQRVSDWVPKDVRQAQAPSADSADALWALVRLWSGTADRPPRTRQYWIGLAEEAREAPLTTPAETSGAPEPTAPSPVPEYDLNQLGEKEFGRLVRLLARAEAGEPVAVDHTEPDGPSLPDGREVAVCFVRPNAWSGTRIPIIWLAELAADLGSRGIPAHRVLVCTNLPGTPDPEARLRSPHDETLRVRQLATRELRGLRIWHQQDVRARLHAHPELRRLYAGFVTPIDTPAQVGEFLDGVAAGVTARLVQGPIGAPTRVSEFLDGVATGTTARLVHAHTATELLSDQWVRLGQAGAEGDRQRLSLGTVAIDLEATTSAQDTDLTVQSARYVIERGDHLLRPSSRPKEAGLLDLALIGGPGQGKSTLGQLICQAYRVSLLGKDDSVYLSSSTRALLHALRSDLGAAGIPLPRVRRWPIRIALHDFANHLATGGDRSILRYLTSRIGRQLNGRFGTEPLEQWLAHWPWFLVLDGLDEVASPEVREDVMMAIEEFLLHVRQLDADHLILATTRPQGYRGEFHVGDFQQLRLSPLSPEAARHYAQRLADARHADDPEMRRAVVTRFGEAAQQPNTARLMSSPLQVTIMSLLVERRTRMPQNRFELFEAYYSTIYAREVDKPGETGRLLAEHKGHIDWMHQYVGLTLQSRAGQAGELDSVMSEWELRQRSRTRMVEETEDPSQAADLAPQLLDAATERLVLLVAPEAGQVGFEVRSLQEFMAAKALISGPEADILPRLQQLAGRPDWHHTWLLAAAGIFSQRPHLRDGLLTVLRDADTEDRVAMTLRPGLSLAAALVEDDLARAHPRHHRLLLAHACEALDGPMNPTFQGIAQILVTATDRSDGAAEIVLRAAARAVRSPGMSLLTGLVLLQRWVLTDGDSRHMVAGLVDRTMEALDTPTRAAVVAWDPPGHTAFEAFGIQPLHHHRVLGHEPLGPVLAEHKRSAAELVESFDVTVDRVAVSGAELRVLRVVPPPTSDADLMAAIAEAVEAQPLTSWPLASQLRSWLAASALLLQDGQAPPRVQGIN
ncbi:NACHT domain-containing protein [Kitasatospora griseola]|uniref:NACHT domain-containing protein n=1 Tax=Kitasatospora griseola TaxID=2064 RepID=UPI0037F1ABEE